MDSFNDFCRWAGSQRRAALMLGVSEATVSRWAARGCVPTVDAAEKVEAVTHGLFTWTQMMRAPAPTERADSPATDKGGQGDD